MAYAPLPGNISETVEAKQILQENGWDKGLVIYGGLVSESTVKVATAVELLKNQDGFPFKDPKWVDLSFDEKPLSTGKDGKQSMGVSSEMWLKLSGGKGFMPAISIDGKMMSDAYTIVSYFWDTYPDKSLSYEEQRMVKTLLALNCEHSERLLEALKHWGWCAMNGAKKNYQHLGCGKKDLAWEKETVKVVDTFFTFLEDTLQKKKANGPWNGYYVGSKMTLADCALLNWPGSFSLVLGMNIKERYPLTWENWEMLKKTAPAGSNDHFTTFPIFAFIVGMLNARNRGSGLCCLCGKGFYIDNPVYWN